MQKGLKFEDLEIPVNQADAYINYLENKSIWLNNNRKKKNLNETGMRLIEYGGPFLP